MDGDGMCRWVSTESEPDLLEILIGSEGTLGLIVAAQLRGEPLPKWRRALRVAFDDIEDALTGVVVAETLGPAITALDLSAPACIPSGERLGPALLYIDIHAMNETDGRDVLARAKQEMTSLNGKATSISSDALGHIRLVDAIERVRQVVQLTGRKRYFLFDAGIPLLELRSVLSEIAALGAAYGIPFTNSFHAGDGTLHPTPFFSPETPHHIESVRRFWSDVLTIVAEHGGALSGEHGIGREKVGEIPKFYSRRARELSECIRVTFGGCTRFNVGKSVDMTAPDAHERTDEPVPRTLNLAPSRLIVDVPWGVSFDEMVDVVNASGLDLGWTPIGHKGSRDVLATILDGWPSDVCRGGTRVMDRLLGFWFKTSSGFGYLGSNVRKDVSNLGLRRALTTGAWSRPQVLAIRLSLVPLSFARLVVAEIPQGTLTIGLLTCIRTAARCLGSGFAVLNEGGAHIRFAARATSAQAVADALTSDACSGVCVDSPTEINWVRYCALAQANPDAIPDLRTTTVLDDVRQDLRAGRTAWFAPARDRWVVA